MFTKSLKIYTVKTMMQTVKAVTTQSDVLTKTSSKTFTNMDFPKWLIH